MARTQTSMAFEKIAGKLADGVAYGHRGGTALRARPEYRYPLRPSQQENNERLRKANALYNTLDEREADLWTLHGERHPRRDPMSGTLYALPAKNLLVGLSCKLLQIDPNARLPRLPPAGTFHADLIDVRVESHTPSFHSGENGPPRETAQDCEAQHPLASSPRWKGPGDGEREPLDSLPPTPSIASERGGGLLFTAPRASRPGALTELMAQPLKNVRCKPGTFYKSRGFATFPEGDLAVFLPLPLGVYAVAIQSVEASSGRTAGLTLLGKVTVE